MNFDFYINIQLRNLLFYDFRVEDMCKLVDNVIDFFNYRDSEEVNVILLRLFDINGKKWNGGECNYRERVGGYFIIGYEECLWDLSKCWCGYVVGR